MTSGSGALQDDLIGAVPHDDTPKIISILGATGSIGRSTAQILKLHPDRFRVSAVAGGRDAEALAKTAIALGARFAALADASRYLDLKAALAKTDIECAAGPDAVAEAARRPSDLVIGAIAGTAGMKPTFAAIEAGRTIALANKETLVCAGTAVMESVTRHGAKLLPLDSEHNAIFQALGDADWRSIERMTLTASGGPFRTWTAEQIAAATVDQALAHPNWAMGYKVTIDSAGLINKGLELIEAHHLFADRPLPYLSAPDRERRQEARPRDRRDPDVRGTGPCAFPWVGDCHRRLAAGQGFADGVQCRQRSRGGSLRGTPHRLLRHRADRAAGLRRDHRRRDRPDTVRYRRSHGGCPCCERKGRGSLGLNRAK